MAVPRRARAPTSYDPWRWRGGRDIRSAGAAVSGAE